MTFVLARFTTERFHGGSQLTPTSGTYLRLRTSLTGHHPPFSRTTIHLPATKTSKFETDMPTPTSPVVEQHGLFGIGRSFGAIRPDSRLLASTHCQADEACGAPGTTPRPSPSQPPPPPACRHCSWRFHCHHHPWPLYRCCRPCRYSRHRRALGTA